MALTGHFNSAYNRRCYKCVPWQDIEPTDRVNKEHRVWKCPKCGTETLWLNDPLMDGSNAQLHKRKEGGFSCLSMLNDPDCTVFSKPAPPIRRTTRTTIPVLPENPVLEEERKPLFVEDEEGNKTHRWHYGRGEWVRIDQHK